MTIKVIQPKWNWDEDGDCWYGVTPFGMFTVVNPQPGVWNVWLLANGNETVLRSGFSSADNAKKYTETWYADCIMRSVEVKE